MNKKNFLLKYSQLLYFQKQTNKKHVTLYVKLKKNHKNMYDATYIIRNIYRMQYKIYHIKKKISYAGAKPGVSDIL